MDIIISSLIWTFIGLTFIIAEFFIMPSIGLLFLGLGSLTTAILSHYYDHISVLYQLIYTGLFSLTWFALLWWPLHEFIYAKKNKGQDDYFDLVGAKVQVIDEKIEPGNKGAALWSGTIMNIKLIDTEKSIAKKGDHLYIKKVKGNILYCSRKI